MPIYEYECAKCGHQSEVWQKFSDPPLTRCETCKGKMKKLISQSSFHLKGTGWYVTDYAGKSGEKKEITDKSPKTTETTETTQTKETKSSTEKTKEKKASAGGKNSKD